VEGEPYAKPPHEFDEIAVDLDIQGEKTLYRLRAEGDKISGGWLVERNVLENADYKSELVDRMSLLPEEWGTEYSAVSRLETSEVEIDARLRVSTASPLESDATGAVRSGGAKQYRLLSGDDGDVENGWYNEGSIERFVEVEDNNE